MRTKHEDQVSCTDTDESSPRGGHEVDIMYLPCWHEHVLGFPNDLRSGVTASSTMHQGRVVLHLRRVLFLREYDSLHSENVRVVFDFWAPTITTTSLMPHHIIDYLHHTGKYWTLRIATPSTDTFKLRHQYPRLRVVHLVQRTRTTRRRLL